MTELIITKPDDMHLHLREGDILKHVIKDTIKQFARAIVMPNLQDPIKSVNQAEIYYQEIKKNTINSNFEPLMTLFFNNTLNSDEIKSLALKLKTEMGGWVFHNKVDWEAKTPHIHVNHTCKEFLEK